MDTVVVVKVIDVCFAYLNAREAYEHFTNMGVEKQQARNAVAVLLWLEQATDVMTVRNVRGFNAHSTLCLSSEANAVLACVRGKPSNFLSFPVEIPFISTLCNRTIDPGFYVFQQDIAAHCIADILDGIGTLIFDDHIYLRYSRYRTGLFYRFPELEAPYTFRVLTVPEDYRSMFITFSRGQHLNREEIFDYFRQRWGDCIVRVLMEKTTGGAPPMYGRVIFRSEAFISLVLNGDQLVKVTINDRQIWLRRYIPRPGNSNNA
ncbi:hypothetical protein QOZ80_3AG0224100 [Eleusine coracana subsp. coracana]|nr:hypothetical protein QOZ80_3AG0224100 [Eleusine coracana subsp. coracana]